MSTKINVAPSSISGHFIEDSIEVIDLDKVNETFVVMGASKMTTKNHTTLINKESCLVTCQTVYNPFTETIQRAKD